MPYIEQIVIPWNKTSIGWRVERTKFPLRNLWNLYDRALFRAFWTRLQHRFPRVTRVVINDTRQSEVSQLVPRDVSILMNLCPSGISVSLSTEQIIVYDWNRNHVLLPAKKFEGLLGDGFN